MQVDEVFKAAPMSIFELLSERGRGYYLPAYQRDYTWGATNIDRLFEDLAHGLRGLLNDEDAITFLGSVITVHDTRYETVDPQETGDLPGNVMVVIDGQQRLTSLLLMIASLDEEVRRRSEDIRDRPGAASAWLAEQGLGQSGDLRIALEEELATGDSEFRHYPRLIRAYKDSWSKKASKARYTSPIARFLREYGLHCRGSSPFQRYYFNPIDSAPAPERKLHEVIKRNCARVRANIKSMIDPRDDNTDLPSPNEIADSETLQMTLFRTPLLDDVKAELNGTGSLGVEDRKDFIELLNVVIFNRYLLDRAAVTVVTAKNESYAFDMFEALNTTGEPLTAYETFKPRVIAAEGHSQYEKSPSKKSMDTIEDYLNSRGGNADQKQKATTALMLPFALAESGEKRSAHLSDQRKYLQSHFEKQDSTLAEKREFVKHLGHVAGFVHNAWVNDPTASFLGSFEDDDLGKTCLDFLRVAPHPIAIAPLSRFASKVRLALPNERVAAARELEKAIRAVTAFFVLWRSSRLSTENIDGHYRTIMREASDVLSLPALNRTATPLPMVQCLVDRLKWVLAEHGGIQTVEDYVTKTSPIPIYQISSSLCRFILLSAAHDTVFDPDRDGHVKAGREGTLEMLSLGKWKDDTTLTVEHVAPQKPAPNDNSWDEDIYSVPETIHRLGNLTLLSLKGNASLGNRPWQEKRGMYGILSAIDEDTMEGRIGEFKNAGFQTGIDTEVLLSSEYVPQVDALGRLSTDWTLAFVGERSDSLARLAWRKLSPWLDIS
jgi:hypothetical protein